MFRSVLKSSPFPGALTFYSFSQGYHSRMLARKALFYKICGNTSKKHTMDAILCSLNDTVRF